MGQDVETGAVKARDSLSQEEKRGKMKLPDFQKNRGVKMTILGFISMTLVRLGCYFGGVPDSIGSELMWASGVLFGVGVGGQKLADGLSKGETATVKNDKE